MIATTAHRHSQAESEKHTILSIDESADGTEAILTLEQPLVYTHTGEDETYDGPVGTVTVPFRAEVGLLTRSILIRG